jgi:high-affinity nickel-transport protein
MAVVGWTMLNLGLAFLTSLLLGMRHATDPDHILAVSTIVSRERSIWRASGAGVLWGVGHTLTIVTVGGAIVLFKLTMTPTVGLSFEMTVAAMLITLGALNLFEVNDRRGTIRSMRPFAVGVVHGLAGSAAATLLIVPLIADPRWTALYLGVFGLGTILGMVLVTIAIATPAVYVGGRLLGIQRGIRQACGALSIAFGLYLGLKIGFVDGLFTGRLT